MKKKLLLHTCCAPCSAYVLKLLETFDVSVFYYNPNIDTKEEYEKRKIECERYCEKNDIKFIEEAYKPDEWQSYVTGLEKEPEGGARCAKCFELRLSKTAKYAEEGGFDFFATTLSISPHKSSEVISAVGISIAKKHEVPFYNMDWKKNDGYQKSCEISRQESFYRQCYCGCQYSKR